MGRAWPGHDHLAGRVSYERYRHEADRRYGVDYGLDDMRALTFQIGPWHIGIFQTKDIRPRTAYLEEIKMGVSINLHRDRPIPKRPLPQR